MTLDREQLYSALAGQLHWLVEDWDGIGNRLVDNVEMWRLKQAQICIATMIALAEGKTQLRISRLQKAT